MQFSTIALLFAATALGAPTESLIASGLRMRGEVDQGEGFYLAVFNNETEATSTVDKRNLLKRATVCSGRRSINLGQLDEANRQLVSNANVQGWYNKGANGWVHLGGETSFFCNYQGDYLAYQLIIDVHTVVSHYCGQDGYGHDRRTNGGGANDLAVGRTWRGDRFC